MINPNIPIYLASKSPRRRKLLKQIGLKFKSFSVDVNEEFLDGEHPIKTVKRLAEHKMETALKKVANGLVITADTIVVLEGKVLGKPKDREDARKILKLLSGKTHTVYTGFAIVYKEKSRSIVDYKRTAVKFRDLTSKEIDEYVQTGSPMDKAGAYGIQDDFGAVFVEKIDGCFYNVMGLPLSKLYTDLLTIVK